MSTVNQRKSDPVEVSRFISAFAECSTEIQNYVLEMTGIVSDESSTDDERSLAFDAISEALWTGLTADVVEQHSKLLRDEIGVEARKVIDEEGKTFAENVRAALEKKGMTQDELAKEVGVTQPAIANILARHCRPQRKTVHKIADALGVTATSLWPTGESK